jgi:branched-chain amino acid transport system substrate-binding protein
MKKKSLFYFVCSLLGIYLLLNAHAVFSQGPAELKEIRIGAICSLTGGLAPAGGIFAYRGLMMGIDAINERGGVMGKYKIVPVIADDQSNPDISVREVERLVSVEKLPIILGTFGSGVATACAGASERNKTIWWNCSGIADGVLKDKHYRYVFRTSMMGSDFGRAAVRYIAQNYKKIGLKSLNEVKAASLTEDSPYGSYVRLGNREESKKLGVPIVFDEAYSYNTKDMSSLILKIKASGQNVILHTGYAPDIMLFNKQARELGLKTKMFVGEGTLYSDNAQMEKVLGKDYVNYLHSIDLCPLQLMNKKNVTLEIGKLIEEFSERALKKYNDPNPGALYSYTFSGLWVLCRNVLPVVIEKFGKITPDTVREVCTKLDIPDGQTPMWYGVKFEPPEAEYAGQNMKAFPTVVQYVDGKPYPVFPESIRTIDPVIPLPSTHPLAQ